MSVFLGNSGNVEIRRNALNQALVTTLDPDDVNPTRNRFSVDFARGTLITGDEVTIATSDKSPLELVAGHVDATGAYYPDWRGYVHIDDVGGIRLYDEFSPSLAGKFDDALPLVQPTSSTPLLIQTRDDDYNCLASITQYEITTSRDQVQTDALGDEFRSYYEAGMISGQGTLDCFWEHQASLCEYGKGVDTPEFSSYLARLIIRLKQGAGFDARFFIYNSTDQPSVWYEAKCIVTNVAVNVEPSQLVRTQIQFATTGIIELHQGTPPAYLLQEDRNKLLQENGSPILLEESD